MKKTEHLDAGALIQYLDGELEEHQLVAMQAHLDVCLLCRRKVDDFARLSGGVAELVSLGATTGPLGSRSRLAEALSLNSLGQEAGLKTSKVLRRFAWGTAIAATLAIGLFLAPHANQRVKVSAQNSSAAASTSIEVNGESFIALPYSDPDLPLSAPRIVEMQVPVASLASAGVLLEPVANGSTDRTVVANVLLGVDGQPLGIHILSDE